MVTHIVMFRLHDRSPAGVEAVTAPLRSLEGNVPTLRSIEVGANSAPGPDGCDVVLVTRFDDVEGLDAYRSHPFHLGVVEKIKPMVATRSYVDF